MTASRRLPVPASTVEQASGGGYEGAQRLSRSVGTWFPSQGSGDALLLPEKELMDGRSHDILRNDAFAVGAMEKYQDSIVGPMYRLNIDPDVDMLRRGNPAFDESWAEDFQNEVESKFHLFAESRNHWLDASGHGTFTDLIRLAIGPAYLATGEVLATAEWIRERGRPYRTAIQMIDSARLTHPEGWPESTRLRGGIRRNEWGRPVSYFIRNSHPGDPVSDWRGLSWREVPAYKPWGRKQVIHIVEQHRIGQSRGVGKMTSALKEMRMRRKLNDMELQNVVLNAMYAAILETDLPADVAAAIVGSIDDPQADNPAYTAYVSQIRNYFGGKNMFLDGVKIPVAPPGTKLNMQRAAATANPQFSFEKSLNRYIARAFGMSYEEFTGDFTESNYSSARAAMGESWKLYQAKRATVADAIATDIMTLWLEEAIARGDIESMPSGFGVIEFNQGLNKEALTRCHWLGAPKPEIDPVKERTADAIGLANNTYTLEEVYAKRGVDFRDALRQIAREKRYAESLGLTLDYGAGTRATVAAASSNAGDDDGRSRGNSGQQNNEPADDNDNGASDE